MASRRALLTTLFIRLWQEDDTGVFWLCRTEERIETLDQAAQVWGAVAAALRGIDRSRHGLLIDFRAARGRNDAAFENTVAPFRTETTRGFRRVAVLTKSTAGALQVQRLAKEDGVGSLRCFDAESPALAWLQTGLWPSISPPQ